MSHCPGATHRDNAAQIAVTTQPWKFRHIHCGLSDTVRLLVHVLKPQPARPLCSALTIIYTSYCRVLLLQLHTTHSLFFILIERRFLFIFTVKQQLFCHNSWSVKLFFYIFNVIGIMFVAFLAVWFCKLFVSGYWSGLHWFANICRDAIDF